MRGKLCDGKFEKVLLRCGNVPLYMPNVHIFISYKGCCKKNEMLALNVDISGNKGRTNLVHLSFESSGSKLSNGRRNISVSVLVKEIYPILQSLCKSEGCNNFSEKSQCSMGYISGTKKATEIFHPPLESPNPKLSGDR